MEDVNESSRTELDSHANMPVIGRNAYILSKIGETVDVAPFTPQWRSQDPDHQKGTTCTIDDS